MSNYGSLPLVSTMKRVWVSNKTQPAGALLLRVPMPPLPTSPDLFHSRAALVGYRSVGGKKGRHNFSKKGWGAYRNALAQAPSHALTQAAPRSPSSAVFKDWFMFFICYFPSSLSCRDGYAHIWNSILNDDDGRVRRDDCIASSLGLLAVFALIRAWCISRKRNLSDAPSDLFIIQIHSNFSMTGCSRSWIQSAILSAVLVHVRLMVNIHSRWNSFIWNLLFVIPTHLVHFPISPSSRADQLFIQGDIRNAL